MSTTVDQRVVEMRFDNKHFEQNVSTTMSTLDKLKQKLHLPGAVKGLDDVSKAASKVDLSGIGKSADTVGLKFSAMFTIADQTLRNITNSAYAAGKRIVSALTIDPVKTGFSEYELKMGSIQTIMASTGESLDTVNGYLNQLNEYSDKTIYSFSDMTQNIGKFTNAGVKLNDAVKAIQGVSNVAAVSGANANEASRAMYNFAQALSAGYVKLIDWKSIENANMATVEFKNYLLEAAAAAGTLTKTGDGMYKTFGGDVVSATKNFNESLQEQWMTTDVLISVLSDYADETTEIGKKAFASAQDVKTLSQLFDTLKESAQSGWAQTWELIVGDFEESKKLFTMLSEKIGGFINGMSEARNKFLGGALNSKWEQMIDKIEAAGGSAEKFNEVLTETAKEAGIPIDDLVEKYGSLEKAFRHIKNPTEIITNALRKMVGAEGDVTKVTNKVTGEIEELEKVVKRVLSGEFGNGEERVKKLTEAGYDYATVQNKVNETLGVSYRHVAKLTEEQRANADSLSKLSDEQLKSAGFTEEQIKALRELDEAARKGGTSINDLIDDMTQPSGRELIFDSFANLWEQIKKPLNAIKEAWNDSIGKSITSDGLYKVLESIHDFTEELEISEETVDNFKTICEGLFAAFQLGHSVFSMSVVGGLKIASAVLELFGTDLLKVAGHISDYIIKLRDWIKNNTIFIGQWDKIGSVIYAVLDGIKRVVKAFLGLDIIKKTVENLKNLIVGWFEALTSGIEGFNIEGLAKTIENFFTRIETWVKNLDKNPAFAAFINWIKQTAIAIKEWFVNIGNSKAMTVFIGWLKNCVTAVKTWFSKLKDPATLSAFWAWIKKTASAIKEWFAAVKNSEGMSKFINWIKQTVIAIKDLFVGLKDTKGIQEFIKWIKSIGGSLLSWLNGMKDAESIPKYILSGLLNGLRAGVGKVWNAAIEIAKALVNSIKAFLGIHSPSTVFAAIGGFIIAGLIGGLLGGTTDITDALKTIGQTVIDFFRGIDLGTVVAAGLGVGTILMVKKVIDIVDKFASAAKGIGKLTSNLGDLVGTINDGLIGKFKPSKWTTISNAILKFAIAIGILVASVVILSKIDSAKLWPAIGALATIGAIIAGFAGIMIALMAATKLISGSKNVDTIGATLLKVAAAIAVMILVAKLAAKMTVGELAKGGLAIVAFSGLIVGLMAATKLITGSKNVDKIGATLFKIAAAIAVMVLVAKLAASMSTAELLRGGIAVAAFAGIIVGLIAATKLLKGSNNVDKIGSSIFKIAAAIAVMILVAKLAASMSVGELVKGGLAITAFAGIIVGLMYATKLINGSKNIDSMGSTILKVAAAIAVMIIVAKIASKMTVGELIQGGLAVAAFAGIIVGLMYATKLINGSTNVDKIGTTLLKVSGAIAVMILVAKLAASMSIGDLIKGGIVVAAFAGIIVGLMYATKLISGSKNIDKMGNMLLKMAGVIAALAICVALLSLINPSRLAVATGALVAIMGVFTLLTKVASKASGANKAIPALITLTVIVGLLAGIIYLLTKGLEDTSIETTIATVGALAGLLLVMTGVLALLQLISKIGGKAFSGILALTLMAVPLIAFVGVLAVMQHVDNALNNVIALSALAAAMTLLLLPLSLVGALVSVAIPGIIALTLMAVPLIAFVGVLAVMQGVENAQANTLALIALTSALTLMLLPLSLVGALAVVAIPGILALVAMCIPLLAFVGILAIMENIQNAETNVNLLIGMMSTLTGLLTRLAIIGPFALIGVTALGALTLLMGAIGVMAVAVGALMEKFPALERFLDTGLDILKRLAGGIGEIISSFAVGLTSGLPQIGTHLGMFMTNLTPFLVGIKMVDDSVKSGVTTLVAAILALTVADLVNGIAELLPMGSGLAQLGTELSQFMMNALPFVVLSSKIDPAACEGVKALAEMMLILTAADILDGLTSWLTGGVSLAKFGEELASLGPHMKAYSDAVKGVDAEAITASANAAKTLSEMAKNLPNSGGWLGAIVGENDMDTFGAQLTSFGESLKAYSVAVTGIVVEPIYASVDAAKKLAELADALPNTGGMWGWIAGDNDMATFGLNLVSFGTSLKMYSTIVTGLSVDAIGTSVDAATRLATLAEALPTTGGLWGWLAGDNDLATFGYNLVYFGSALKTYSLMVTGLDIEAVNVSIGAARKIVALSNLLPEDEGLFKKDKMNAFADNIKQLGKGMEKYSEHVVNIDASAVSGSITSAQRILNMLRDLASLDTSGVKSFKDAIDELAEVNLTGIKDAFSVSIPDFAAIGKSIVNAIASGISSGSSAAVSAASQLIRALVTGFTSGYSTVVAATQLLVLTMQTVFMSSSGRFQSIGAMLVSRLVSGVLRHSRSVATAMRVIVASAIASVTGYYSSFYNAGDYVVQGFANGISANTWKAEAKARAMAKAALEAAEEALGIASPSKEAEKDGEFTGEGFIQGLTKWFTPANDAGTELGNSAADGISTGVSSGIKNAEEKIAKAIYSEELGRWIVDDIAAGIKDDMSAEEAAKKKAQNIVDAFKTELDKVDRDIKTADLEYDLWESKNPNASEAERDTAKIESLNKQIDHQNAKVTLAQSEYFETLNAFGKDAEETQEAYNKYLTEQVTLAGLMNDVTEIQNDAIERNKESFEKAQEAAKALKEANAARPDLDLSKWEAMYGNTASDPAKVVAELYTAAKNIPHAITALGDAKKAYADALADPTKTEAEIAEAYNAIIEAETNLASILNNATKTHADTLQEQLDAQKEYDQLVAQWKTIALNRGISEADFEKWAKEQTGYDADALKALQKINPTEIAAVVNDMITPSNLEGAVDPFAQLANAIIMGKTSFEDALGEYAEIVTEGPNTGIQNGPSGATSAVNELSDTCTQTIEADEPKWIDAGKKAIAAFAQGIKDGAEAAVEAADEVANRTLTAFNNALAPILSILTGETELTPRIRPIMDLSDVHSGSAQLQRMFAYSTASLASANAGLANGGAINLNQTLTNSNAEVVKAIDELRGDFGSLVRAINGMQIRMDSGTVVGELIGKIDANLGQIANHKGRGN